MTYIQVTVNGQPLQPTKGDPYKFFTIQEAIDTVDMCYGRESLKKEVAILLVSDSGSVDISEHFISKKAS